MKLHKRQVIFGGIFAALSLVLYMLLSTYPTTHAVTLKSVNDRAKECQQSVMSTPDCPVCNLPKYLYDPNYKPKPLGFPFTDSTNSLCPASPVRNAEALDGAVGVLVAAVVAGGTYVAFGKFRKAGSHGK